MVAGPAAKGEEEKGRSGASRLQVEQVTHILSFLPAAAVGRAACVCGLWHGAAEHGSLWARLGVRRWELSLRGVLDSRVGSAGARQGSRKNFKTHLAVLESRALQEEGQLW